MRKLAVVMFCLVCGQGTVFAEQKQPEQKQQEQKQPVIYSAAVDSASQYLIISGRNFGSNPDVTVDDMRVRVVQGSSQVLVVELPASVLAQPGTYRLTVESHAGDKGTARFVVAVGGGGSGAGAKGDKGDPGPKGDKGDAGLQGLKGDKGDPGVKGDAGTQGIQGIQGLKGDKGDAGQNGAPGQNGSPGLNGLNGQDGAPGVKGDTGPAGEGSLRIVDENGKTVGAFAYPNTVLVTIGTDVFRMLLDGVKLPSCSSAGGACLMYGYTETDCSGTPYMNAEKVLAPEGFLVDGVIRYPSGPVASRTLAAIRIDNGVCMNLQSPGSQTGVEAKSAPLATLGITAGDYHLAK